MKKNIFLITLLLAFTTLIAGVDENNKNTEAASNRNIEVKGTVTDFANGDALAGVEVQIKETKQKAYTDFDGEFSFDEITPGKYTIVVSYISYDKSIVEEIEVKNSAEGISIKLKDL